MYSQRRHLLTRLAPELANFELAAPARMHVDWARVSATAGGDSEALDAIVADARREALGTRLFAQACPHDESKRRDLSFAGVYRTYHPKRHRSQGENIIAGLSHVLAGRNNRYADIYYDRHGIDGERQIDIKFANYVDRIIAIGTAYVHGQRCLLQYFDSYLSLYVNDPVRAYADRGAAIGASSAWEARLSRAFFDAADFLESPLDIEFVITAEDVIYLTQVRAISEAHLRLWDRVSEETWARIQRTGPPSISLNSVALFHGSVVDLRRRPPDDADARPGEPIYVVHHQEVGTTGTGALRFLEWANAHRLADFALLVDHGDNRRNDHLDYILAEDPGAIFVAASAELPPSFDRASLTLESDGFAVSWR